MEEFGEKIQVYSLVYKLEKHTIMALSNKLLYAKRSFYYHVVVEYCALSQDLTTQSLRKYLVNQSLFCFLWHLIYAFCGLFSYEKY